MRTLMIIILLLLAITQTAYAGEIGRYQAVAIPKSNGDPKAVFVIDTKEGHMWFWTEYPTIPNISQGGRYLIYQGKLKPGQKFGDTIERQQFK